MVSSLVSTQPEMFGGRKMLSVNQRTFRHGGGNIMVRAVFLLRVEDDFTTLRVKWTEPCAVKCWMRKRTKEQLKKKNIKFIE